MKIYRTIPPFGLLISWSLLIPFALLAMNSKMTFLLFCIALPAWYRLFTYTEKLELFSIEGEKELNPKMALGLLIGYIFTTFLMLLLSTDALKMMFYFILITIIAITLIHLLAVDINPNSSGETV